MNSSDVDGVLRFEEGGAEECSSGREGPSMDGVTLPSMRSGRKGRGGKQEDGVGRSVASPRRDWRGVGRRWRGVFVFLIIAFVFFCTFFILFFLFSIQ